MHIDASLMRVVVDGSLLEGQELLDPASSLYRNLQGRFEPDVYPWGEHDRLSRAFDASIIIAHEHRHYLDYHLTNYGSWLTRLNPQIKQSVSALLTHDGTVPIPLHHWSDDSWLKLAGVRPPQNEFARAAARLAGSRARVLAADKVPVPYGGYASGGAQLEALATAFEVGPAERLLPREEQLAMSLRVRDAEAWQRNYVWPARLFDVIGLGREPERLAGLTHIVDTRTWPTFLVSALMGQFTDMTSVRAGDAGLASRVLPSSRFIQRLDWFHRRHRPKRIVDPEEAWEACNAACHELFGATVVESMVTEIQQLDAQIGGTAAAAGRTMSLSLVEMLSHLEIRKQMAEAFQADPMAYLDPVRYWADSDHPVRMVPDYLLVNRNGFAELPQEHQSLRAFPYKIEVSGRPVFVKRRAASDSIARWEDEDETLSALGRFYLTGHLSNSWAGPELEVVARQVLNVLVVPPYGSRPSAPLFASLADPGGVPRTG